MGEDPSNGIASVLGPSGTLSVTYVAPLGSTVHVIFDVEGYYTADAIGAKYHALTPTRILDSRQGIGLSGPSRSHVARTFAVTGGVVPWGATAVTGNLTVTQPTSNGYLYIGPFAMNDPTITTLNFFAGQNRTNAVTVALGGGGTLGITYVAPTLGPTAQVIFEVTGYFAL